METTYKLLKKPIEYLSVGVSSIVFLILQLRLYGETWSAPFTKGGDADFHFIMVRTIQKTGWIFENPQLGSPKTSRIYDVPQGGDNLHWLMMKAISYFASAVVTVNLYFVLSFAIVSIAAYGSARWYGLARLSSYFISILYAFLPYHFYRGENHLLLSMYFVIPIAVVFAYKTCTVNSRYNRWLIGLFAAVVASTGAYYFIFTLMLVGFAFVINLLNKNKAMLKQQLFFIFISTGVFIFNQIPTIIFVLKNGSNSKAAVRSIADAESYGLQITDMFTPRTDHRIPFFARIAKTIYSTGISSEAGQSIGMIASLGIIFLLLFTIKSVIQSKPLPSESKFFALYVTAIMLFTVSSGPTLIVGILGFTQIRSWNRVVVIIAFIGLLCFGYYIDKFRNRISSDVIKYIYTTGVLIVLLLGFLDLTSNADLFYTKGNALKIKNDCDIIKMIDEKKPKTPNVFQFPYIAYPEGEDLFDLKHYDQAMQILCDTNLNFSFGAMVGRDDQLQKSLSTRTVLNDNDISKLKSNKFSVIEVYRSGYSDNGVVFEKSLKDKFGEPLVSNNGLIAAYFIN